MVDSIKCWKYFNCPKQYRNICSVYHTRKTCSILFEGWFEYNPLVGGPAKRGPCVKCDILKISCPNAYSYFEEREI